MFHNNLLVVLCFIVMFLVAIIAVIAMLFQRSVYFYERTAGLELYLYTKGTLKSDKRFPRLVMLFFFSFFVSTLQRCELAVKYLCFRIVQLNNVYVFIERSENVVKLQTLLQKVVHSISKLEESCTFRLTTSSHEAV